MTTTAPRRKSPGIPQLAPLPDGYGPDGRSEWLDIDWRRHLRSCTVNGARVNYVEMEPDDKSAARPPLVFVHGLAGCWQNWLENIPHFGRSRRVIAIDLPGFGESELPREEISIPGYGRFVDAFLDKIGVACASVVGNSMGGFIAAEVALSHPSRVDKLALVSAAGLSTVPRTELALVKRLARTFHLGTARVIARRETMVRRRRLRKMLLYGVVRYPALLQPELVYEIASGGGKPGFLDAFRAVLDYDFSDRVPKIERPTLVVWGRNDRIVPVGGAYRYERLIPGSRRVIFEDTGHVPMIERPALFNQLLEEFLNE
ncbi:MAG: alpha/beta fold hydrolase [Solirubrobacterales bacterium]